MQPKVKLLALDVDGTLIGPDQKIPPDVVEALYHASRAGVRVCLATGRSLVETLPIWRQLRFPENIRPEAIVVIGGALVAEPDTTRTLYQQPLDADLAQECGEILTRMGRSPMAIVDVWRWGFDYLFIESDDYGGAHKQWFAQMPNANIRKVTHFNGQGPEILRINVVAQDNEGPQIEKEMKRHFGDRLNIHAIFAPNYNVTVVEMFAKAADKWTAIKYIAQGYRIGPGAIAAAGDDINDTPMLHAAGIGIAMPKAPPHVKAAADVIAENGLAEIIEKITVK